MKERLQLQDALHSHQRPSIDAAPSTQLIPAMQPSSRLALTVIVAVCIARGAAAAQEGPPTRAHFSFGLSAITRVPVFRDEVLGPLGSVTLHVPAGEAGGLLIGAGYGIVYTDGLTIDGVHYDYATEALILGLGAEFLMGQRRQLAIDAQWNPAVAHLRYRDRMPEWFNTSSEWLRTFAVGSLGARWTLPTTRGPAIAVALRAYVHLHPYAVSAGPSVWPALGVVLRAR